MDRIRTPMLCAATLLAGLAAIVASGPSTAQTWEPTRPIELVVPAGTGGGADQMARAVQGIVTKYALSKQSMIVVNKGGGAGAEGFLDVKGNAGNPHKIIITLSNLFTTPLATGVPFNWKDLTPLAMMALDEFVLWVNAEAPYKTSKDYIDAIKAAPAGQFKMGGTGSRQEDQIITVAIEKAAGVKFTYVPYGGGGEVATQLVGKHIDSSVNNPIEAVAQWRAGALRPVCVLDGTALSVKDKMTATMAWADIPTCKSQGLDVEYLMLRGFFGSPGMTAAQVKYYTDLFQKVREQPEWAELMKNGAFNQTVMSGDDFRKWLEKEEARHRTLMTEAGFLAK